MDPAVTIHIIDDEQGVRDALRRLLSARGWRVCVHESADRFIEAAPAPAPGCILLDLNMPGLSGLELQAHLVAARNPFPIVFLTGAGDIASSVRAIKAGAEDFLPKPVRSEQLFDAIARALDRYAVAVREQGALHALTERADSLTPREREVFGLVVQGLLNKQIAYQLGNTERTVKEQRRSVMEKMRAGSLPELVMAAARLGLLKNS